MGKRRDKTCQGASPDAMKTIQKDRQEEEVKEWTRYEKLYWLSGFIGKWKAKDEQKLDTFHFPNSNPEGAEEKKNRRKRLSV